MFTRCVSVVLRVCVQRRDVTIIMTSLRLTHNLCIVRDVISSNAGSESGGRVDITLLWAINIRKERMFVNYFD